MASLDDTLDVLAANLDEVEAILKPLLAHPLEDTLASLAGPEERAKLLFWIAYAAHSCSWIYTKLRAIEPEEHGVMEEINRIQKYNTKILSLKQEKQKKDERNMRVDKDVAGRFIKAAISNQPARPSATSSFYSASATIQDPLVSDIGRHTRFSGLKRQEDASESKAGTSSSSDEELEVVDGDLAGGAKSGDGKGKKRMWGEEETAGVAGQSESEASLSRKAQNPLQGYESPLGQSKKSKKAKKNKPAVKNPDISPAKSQALETIMAEASSTDSSASGSRPDRDMDGSGLSKKQRKKQKRREREKKEQEKQEQ